MRGCTSQEIVNVSAVIVPLTKLPAGEQRGTASLPAPSSRLLPTSPRRAEFLRCIALSQETLDDGEL